MARVKRAGRPPARTPTYGAAVRLATIVLGLLSRPQGWSLGAIQDELRISERTLLRYLSVCRRELLDPSGKPVIDVIRRGDQRFVSFAGSSATDTGTFEAVFFYFTSSLLTFLEGTVLKQGVDGIWDRILKGLTPRQHARLAHLTKKFYAVPYAVKDYRAFDDQLDLVVRCLLDQYRMRIDYQGVLGEGRVHEVEPYTLALYRGGLYLIGHSSVFDKIIWLAVERIRTATRLPDRFDYPSGYSPEKHTEGMFGIIDGPETDVSLRLRSKQTAAFLRSRRLHPTQKFHAEPDGTTLLTMRVRGTAELTSWILGLGPWVEVLAPASLRREVGEHLRAAAKLYQNPRARRSPGRVTRPKPAV